MLIDLEAFDIVTCKDNGSRHGSSQDAKANLCRWRAASGGRDNHVGSGLRNEEEENDEVAVEAVEEDELVPNDWNGLEADKKASRKYAGQVENDGRKHCLPIQMSNPYLRARGVEPSRQRLTDRS